MNLIETYIYEVTRRLPEKMRKDIGMELGSTIEDMLPDGHTEEDVKNVLMILGDPAKLANEYHDKPRYIIGPYFYEPYINILILAALFSVIISSLSHFVNGVFAFDGEQSLLPFIGQLLLKMLVSSLNVLFQVFFWVTIVFIFLERAGVSKEKIYDKKEPWKPEDLYETERVVKQRQIPKAEVFFSLFWTVLWATVLFNASDLLGWYEQTGKGLEGLKLEAPLFNDNILFTYIPFLIFLILIEAGLAAYKFYIGRWTKFLATVNTVYHFISVGLFCIMLNDAELFSDAFTLKLLKAFEGVPASWFIGTIASIMIIFSIIDIVSGFNKASKAKLDFNQLLNR